MFVELAGKRSYNSSHLLKVVVDENGNPILNEQGELVPLLTTDGKRQMKLMAHVGHIHYKDGEEFKPLDWTLLFDEIKRVWTFDTHSYKPEFPEYSDGVMSFRDKFQDKDQTIKYTPIDILKVIGVPIETDPTNPDFDDNPDNKCIVYTDAFGKDRDLLGYNKRSDMVKVATVNNPNECTVPVSFKWKMEVPDMGIFRVDKKEDAEDMTRLATKTNTESGKLVGYKLERRDGKKLNTDKLTLIGNSKINGKEWYTYLKPFKAWDSDGNTIIVDARIDFINGEMILTKTIPLEFLKAAKGRVFTDTTTSYYAGSADDDIYVPQTTTWSTAHDATTGTVRTGTEMYLQSRKLGVDYFIDRIFMTFDTSSIGDSDTIDSASLKVYGFTTSGTGSTFLANVYQNNQASDTSLTGTDFNDTGTTAFSTGVRQDSISTVAYTTFALNASGLAAVSKTGYTKLAIKDQDYDNANVAPAASVYCAFRTSETTGTSNDPYLSVTYTSAAATANPALLFSLIS